MHKPYMYDKRCICALSGCVNVTHMCSGVASLAASCGTSYFSRCRHDLHIIVLETYGVCTYLHTLLCHHVACYVDGWFRLLQQRLACSTHAGLENSSQSALLKPTGSTSMCSLPQKCVAHLARNDIPHAQAGNIQFINMLFPKKHQTKCYDYPRNSLLEDV